MTDVLFLVSHPESGSVLSSLMRACRRQGKSWSCFFTGTGVATLRSHEVTELLIHADKAVACEHSWTGQMGRDQCPVELGSQTANAMLAAESARIISL